MTAKSRTSQQSILGFEPGSTDSKSVVLTIYTISTLHRATLHQEDLAFIKSLFVAEQRMGITVASLNRKKTTPQIGKNHSREISTNPILPISDDLCLTTGNGVPGIGAKYWDCHMHGAVGKTSVRDLLPARIELATFGL